MTVERIYRLHQPTIFITTAQNKAEYAQKAGYVVLPPHLRIIAEEAGRREDLFAELTNLGVADHHYHRNSTIPTTLHVTANKADGADFAYEELKRSNPGGAMDIAGKTYEVMDNQMVIVDPQGKKIALKKPRHDSLAHMLTDIGILISTLKLGSLNGSYVEYLSAFAKGEFGKPTAKEYRTVRTIVGTIRNTIDFQLLGILMSNNTHITGGIDVEELVQYVITHDEAQITVRKYKEGGRHYEGEILFLDKIIPINNTSTRLFADYTSSDPAILAGVARGFVPVS